MDLIERQAAIDAVRENTFRLTFAEEQNCEGHVAWSAEAVYSDVIEGALLELPPAQPEQQWIPCSERLPEDHETKLLTHEVHYITGKVIKDVRMACYDDENDDWLSDEESPEILCYPLAWMPLPEPYREDDYDHT